MAVCLNNARRPRRKRICVSPGRPSVPEVRLPHRASRTCFSFRSLWACRACCPVSPFGPCGPAFPVRPVSPLSLSPFGPCGPAGPASPAGPRSPVALPGRCLTLSFISLRPLRTRGPLFPFGREAPPRWGFGLRLLPPLSCFVPLTVRFLLTPGLFLLRSLHPGCITGCTFCRLLTTQHLLHFVMTHWLFERPQRPRTRTPPLTALQRLHFLPPAGLTPMHPLLKCQHLQRSLLPDWLICRHSSRTSPPLRHSSSPPQRRAASSTISSKRRSASGRTSSSDMAPRKSFSVPG